MKLLKFRHTAMGCCKSKNFWDANFMPTELSSNRCDALWEHIRGDEATFGMSEPFQPCARFGILTGVIRVKVGFAGGSTPAPNLQEAGDHTVVINVEYDPKKVTYEYLLHIFFNYHDILQKHESPEFVTAIEAKRAEQARHELEIQTTIRAFHGFIMAEDQYQHAVLQSHHDVMKALGKNLPQHQMAYSHLACRLDGYVAGYGTPEEFDKERTELYISDRLAAYVRLDCVQNQIPDFGDGHYNDWD